MDKPVIRTRTPWDLGTWAWLANRIAGTVLILYLMEHILLLTSTQTGEQSFNRLMEKVHQPFPLVMEILLLLAVVFHGTNGIRQILIDFGLCTPKSHVVLLWGVIGVTFIILIVSAVIFAPIIIKG